MMFAVLKAWHPMIGVDYHIPWPPGSPLPLPVPSPYLTFHIMIGLGVISRYTTTAYTDGLAPSMVRGTDIGFLIPHIGIPSLTIGLEILLSGSKSHFGPLAINVTDQHGAAGNPAAALFVVANPNLNCGFPLPTPFGAVIAPTTHFVGMTLGDIVAGLLYMGWDFLVQAALNKLGSKLGDWMGKAAGTIAKKMGIGVMGRAASRLAAREAWKAAGKVGPLGAFARAALEADAALLGKVVRIASTWGPAKAGFWIGAPLGPSISNLQSGWALYDHFNGLLGNLVHFNPEMKGVGAAVDDYVNHHLIEEIQSPTPTVAPTSTPTVTPTSTLTSTPTSTPTATPTSTPTATPTSTPTATPTSTPTATPTSTPTSTPTTKPDR